MDKMLKKNLTLREALSEIKCIQQKGKANGTVIIIDCFLFDKGLHMAIS